MKGRRRVKKSSNLVGKSIMGTKILAIKDMLLGVYKTDKCYNVISRPYVRDRLG